MGTYGPMAGTLGRTVMQCQTRGCDEGSGFRPESGNDADALAILSLAMQQEAKMGSRSNALGFLGVVPVAFLLGEMLVTVVRLDLPRVFLDMAHAMLDALDRELQVSPMFFVRPTAEELHGVKPVHDVSQMGTEIGIEFIGGLYRDGVEEAQHRIHSSSHFLVRFLRRRLAQKRLYAAKWGLNTEDVPDEHGQLNAGSRLAARRGLHHLTRSFGTGSRQIVLAKPLSVVPILEAFFFVVRTVFLPLFFVIYTVFTSLFLALRLGSAGHGQRGNSCASRRKRSRPAGGCLVGQECAGGCPSPSRDVSYEKSSQSKSQPRLPFFALLRQRFPYGRNEDCFRTGVFGGFGWHIESVRRNGDARNVTEELEP